MTSRWGDPIKVGDRVHLTLRAITGMPPIGYVVDRASPMYGGVAATTGGEIIHIFDGYFADVAWDDGRTETLALELLVQSELRQSEAVRFHAGMLGGKPSILRQFDRWCDRHPVLSWAFAVALAGDIAFVLAGCTQPQPATIAACQAIDAGNPVHVAECGVAGR